MPRAAYLIGAGFLILSCVGTSEARHYRYHWSNQWFGRYPADRVAHTAVREHDPRFLEKRSGSTLNSAIDQLIGICSEEAVELRKLPPEPI
jgi:hypothetical protein